MGTKLIDDSWTHEDERRYEELAKRRGRVLGARRDELVRSYRAMLAWVRDNHDPDPEDLSKELEDAWIDALQVHAPGLIDALEPYVVRPYAEQG